MILTYVNDCAYQVSSLYIVFNLLIVANMSEKTPRYYGGWYNPLWGSTETTLHSSEKWTILTKDVWDSFHNTSKKYFSYSEERIQMSKTLVRCAPPINPSPTKIVLLYSALIFSFITYLCSCFALEHFPLCCPHVHVRA